MKKYKILCEQIKCEIKSMSEYEENKSVKYLIETNLTWKEGKKSVWKNKMQIILDFKKNQCRKKIMLNSE